VSWWQILLSVVGGIAAYLGLTVLFARWLGTR
jgi:hypothetical protein